MTIFVAWASASGLRALGDQAAKFRERGGEFTLVTGIDNQIATRESLQAGLEIATTAYVVHDTGHGIFHPKLYFAEGQRRAEVLIGSPNLTAGGMHANDEVFALARINESDPSAHQPLASAKQLVAETIADSRICRECTVELIEALEAEDMLATKASPPAKSTQPRTAQFGTRSPHPEKLPKPIPPASRIRPQVEHRWYKQLKASDAQRLRGSSPSGTVTLVKGEHSLDAEEYFRFGMFKSVDWNEIEGKEVANVSAELFIDGVQMEDVEVQIVYDPRLDSGQGNRILAMRWGKSLNAYLRSADRRGSYVTIEREVGNTFRIYLSEEPIGRFI